MQNFECLPAVEIEIKLKTIWKSFYLRKQNKAFWKSSKWIKVQIVYNIKKIYWGKYYYNVNFLNIYVSWDFIKNYKLAKTSLVINKSEFVKKYYIIRLALWA